MVPGGRPRWVLEQVRCDYAVALHGVSLSLGSAEPLNREHLDRLAELAAWVEPAIVSDHLCWTGLGGHNSHDLLPLPFTEEAVALAGSKIQQVQDRLGRRILIENISSYLEFQASTMREWEFLLAVAERADCLILLDVNNVYVNSRNHGFDAGSYIDSLPAERVGQLHIAGHEDRGQAVIDTHDADVCGAVWRLFAHAVERFGPLPALLERDAHIPPLTALLAEAARAQAVLDGFHAASHA